MPIGHGLAGSGIGHGLAGNGIEPERALRLAENEVRVRKDVYGYDAIAWALLANDRPADADEAMSMALAVGTRDANTRDAKLLYHAGMIAADVGNGARALDLLTGALNLDASFDPAAAVRARTTLETLP